MSGDPNFSYTPSSLQSSSPQTKDSNMNTSSNNNSGKGKHGWQSDNSHSRGWGNGQPCVGPNPVARLKNIFEPETDSHSFAKWEPNINVEDTAERANNEDSVPPTAKLTKNLPSSRRIENETKSQFKNLAHEPSCSITSSTQYPINKEPNADPNLPKVVNNSHIVPSKKINYDHLRNVPRFQQAFVSKVSLEKKSLDC